MEPYRTILVGVLLFKKKKKLYSILDHPSVGIHFLCKGFKTGNMGAYKDKFVNK